MIYYLSEWQDTFSVLNVFRYITVRAFGAAATSFMLCIVIGPWLIEKLFALKVQQYVRKDEAPPLYKLHGSKEGTPTMGGLMIIAAMTIATILWARPANPYVWLCVATLWVMGGIGFLDDWLKVTRRQSKGLRARYKFLLQVAWACVVMGVLWGIDDARRHVVELMVPFCKDPVVRDMGFALALVFIVLVLSGSSNAANLTDGLDGLAIGCSGTVALAYLLLAYVAGHARLAEYLLVPHISGSGELAVFCGALFGASLGFLWYNCHPARVFMGDTGSLAIGGAIGMVAILIKQELLLIIVGGVFVMEAVSVIVQVASYKWRGKRVFKMAPLHHHFELRGWSETQVTIRFWILSIIFALLGMLSLKIR